MSAPHSPWLVVARREFSERVRTVWFLLVTLMGPVGLVALIVVPAWLSVSAADDEHTVVVVDRSGREVAAGMLEAVPLIRSQFRFEVVPAAPRPDEQQTELLAQVRDERINGFLILPENTLSGGTALYRGDNATNPTLYRDLLTLVNFAVLTIRANDAGIPRETIAALQTPVPLDVLQTTGDDEGSSAGASMVVGYLASILLYMAVFLYAVNVMRSVVQEKTSRVVELIVSSTRPRSLMLGKIVGVGSVGVLQLLIWLGVALVLLHYRDAVLGLFGVDASGFTVPELSPADAAVAIAFFLVGFFFYASLYAAVGAMVNSEQEAQQAQLPLMLLAMIPALSFHVVATNPRGSLAEILTLIPFSSPSLMPMRYVLDGASTAEVLVSLAALAVATVGAVLLAGRIYRVGILMYGKRPGLRELWRWIRY